MYLISNFFARPNFFLLKKKVCIIINFNLQLDQITSNKYLFPRSPFFLPNENYRILATADKTPTEEQPKPLDTPTTPTSEGKEDAPAAWDADLEVKEEVKDDWEASSEDEAPDSKTEATPAAIEGMLLV